MAEKRWKRNELVEEQVDKRVQVTKLSDGDVLAHRGHHDHQV